jgi:hypothetical protein
MFIKLFIHYNLSNIHMYFVKIGLKSIVVTLSGVFSIFLWDMKYIEIIQNVKCL